VKVLLLHAWPLDERMWEPQARALRAAGHEPTAPRLYGRGPSIDAWAAQLLGEVEGPFVAVGSSMGGYLALALVRRAPERVVGIVLVGSPTALDTPERRAARAQLVAELRGGGASEVLSESDVAPEDLAVAQEAIRDRSDASRLLGAFGGPVLVCVGEHDEHLSVDEARAIADGALVGFVHVFPETGHLVPVEQPDAFTAVLMDFLVQWT
jgi:pimeloyl-ACP methyl ester carboxylesterase